MGVTTTALNVIAANMAGSALATHIAIGTSGTTFASGQTALASETDRNVINEYDIGTQKVTMIANWSPTEISGTILKEYGVMTTGSSMLNREVLTGSIVFDGESELQIQQTFLIHSPT